MLQAGNERVPFQRIPCGWTLYGCCAMQVSSTACQGKPGAGAQISRGFQKTSRVRFQIRTSALADTEELVNKSCVIGVGYAWVSMEGSSRGYIFT